MGAGAVLTVRAGLGSSVSARADVVEGVAVAACARSGSSGD